jgi:NAD-dependent dihydropyrimidine dehydrogenase PreA subunit
MSYPPTLVISRSQPPSPERRALEDALIGGLESVGIPVVVAPDLSLMRRGAKALAFLRAVRGPIVFLSWLQPRAAFWWLCFLGVTGKRARTLPRRTPSDMSQRPIVAFHLGEFASADHWMKRIEKMVQNHPDMLKGESCHLPFPRHERWYPVVDRSRCVECHQCVEFCIFGVYARDRRKHLVVKNPDNCKPGCPACSRVCPSQAIIFPLYAEDAAIAGADGVTIQSIDAAQARALREDFRNGRVSREDVLRAVSGRSSKKTRAAAPSETPASEPQKTADSSEDSRDYFDEWIERLGRE